MPEKLEVTGEVARIVLSGDFDFSTQGNLGNVIEQALNTTAAKEIQVDMGNVTFIDSSFIRTLLQLQDSAKAYHKSLSLWNCNDQIRNTLAIGGFDQLFVIH
jgi:HptB-dependent secretion and biofilm anti anti-sigma factor